MALAAFQEVVEYTHIDVLGAPVAITGGNGNVIDRTVLCLVAVAGCLLHEVRSGRPNVDGLWVVADYVKSSRGWDGGAWVFWGRQRR